MRAVKGRVDEEELKSYRAMDCAVVLPLVSDYCKSDADFVPIKDSHTNRWYLVVDGRQFELLTTGPKWFDPRVKCGGGGAVDLTIHLFGIDFKQAVAMLREVLL